MSDIPEEIRKMFPDQPIHKMDIVDGELIILASSEPLNEPDFEKMPIEQVNQYLRDHGYDPEQVRLRGKILTDALIENINLKSRAEAAEAENKRLREVARAGNTLFQYGLAHDTNCLSKNGYGDHCDCGARDYMDAFILAWDVWKKGGEG